MQKSLSQYFSLSDFRMRNATSDDIMPLVAIINTAYSYQDNAKGAPRTNEKHLSDRMNEVYFYVVEHRDKIVGCVYVEPVGSSLHFGLLTVTPEYRGKKVGSSIMYAIELFARANSYDAISLEYMSLAPWLKNYYEKHGFKETGETIRWGTITLVRMTKNV